MVGSSGKKWEKWWVRWEKVRKKVEIGGEWKWWVGKCKKVAKGGKRERLVGVVGKGVKRWEKNGGEWWEKVGKWKTLIVQAFY